MNIPVGMVLGKPRNSSNDRNRPREDIHREPPPRYMAEAGLHHSSGSVCPPLIRHKPSPRPSVIQRSSMQPSGKAHKGGQHHGKRLPLQVLASPSETKMSPSDWPSRPSHARIVNGPWLVNPRSRTVARSPNAYTAAHRGLDTSGASISATRALTPFTESVSSSTKQLKR